MRDVATLNFEEALGEFEQLVRRLEDARLPLDQAIAAYERGVHLRNHCSKQIADVRLRVEKITSQPDGTLTTEPLKIDT